MRATVAEQRRYDVLNVDNARKIATTWLANSELENAVNLGLPEIDDRYHIWRVPLVAQSGSQRVGEIVIDAYTSLVIENKTTAPDTIEARLLGRQTTRAAGRPQQKRPTTRKRAYVLSSLRNTIAKGDSEEILQDLPAESVDLVFTSPPYFNARPEYTDYVDYQEYLLKIRKVIQQAHRVLNEGRFFVLNVSPVLIRRPHRNASSKRIAVPFDMHRIFIKEGYDFIDDIIWLKPEGAGWATGRGRRFAADRNPLQYKAVPVTEYVLVYRKQTDRLIDWNIRSYPDQQAVQESKIGDDYERTNVWQIGPAHDSRHPAVFPLELAERVIRYYSFQGDVVLDPFAGIGTVGKAAVQLGRRFVLIEKEPRYANIMIEETKLWLGREASNVLTINLPKNTTRSEL